MAAKKQTPRKAFDIDPSLLEPPRSAPSGFGGTVSDEDRIARFNDRVFSQYNTDVQGAIKSWSEVESVPLTSSNGTGLLDKVEALNKAFNIKTYRGMRKDVTVWAPANGITLRTQNRKEKS